MGFAIPHCKSGAVSANSITMLSLSRAVALDSLDGEPVAFVIMIAVREADAGNTHLKVLSRLSRKLMNEEFRSALTGAGSAGEIVSILSTKLDLV